MSESADKKIIIRAPKFEPEETVVLNFKGKRVTCIDKRWYELDRDTWWYQCTGEDVLFYAEHELSKFDYDSYHKELQENIN